MVPPNHTHLREQKTPYLLHPLPGTLERSPYNASSRDKSVCLRHSCYNKKQLSPPMFASNSDKVACSYRLMRSLENTKSLLGFLSTRRKKSLVLFLPPGRNGPFLYEPEPPVPFMFMWIHGYACIQVPTTRSSSLVGAIHNPASTLSARVYTQLTFVLQLRLPTHITSHTLSFHRAGDPLSGASELFLGRLSALGLAPKMTNQLVHFMQAVGRWSALTKHIAGGCTRGPCSLVPRSPVSPTPFACPSCDFSSKSIGLFFPYNFLFNASQKTFGLFHSVQSHCLILPVCSQYKLHLRAPSVHLHFVPHVVSYTTTVRVPFRLHYGSQTLICSLYSS